MDKLIRQNWWKALGVGIMVYVFTVGMLVPLKPGITTVAPGAARTGTDVTLDITADGTHSIGQACPTESGALPGNWNSCARGRISTARSRRPSWPCSRLA